MTGLVERLYRYEDVELEERLWARPPFLLFNPSCQFVRFKPVVRTLRGEADFFFNDTRLNFFPDKSREEAMVARVYAMNKGIKALNDLCQTYLPDIAGDLIIPLIETPFDPIKFFKEAREAYIQAREGTHRGKTTTERGRPIKQENTSFLIKAYNAIRAWGLGHFVLLIDESPEAYHSVSHIPEITRWLDGVMGFRDPIETEEGTAWQTNMGARVYGTKTQPFRFRAKIQNESGDPRYCSLLMKMFLKEGFVEEVHDGFAVEFLVGSEEDENKILDYFRSNLKSTGMLEKYKRFREQGPPAFYRTKFIMRVPVRLPDQNLKPAEGEQKEEGITLKAPLTRYVRPAVEIQIRNMNHPYEHGLYKQEQYAKVFPIWYPRFLYEPLLRSIDSRTAQ